MMLVADRIRQLGSMPRFALDDLASWNDGLSRGMSDKGLFFLDKQNLAAESCIVVHYRRLIEFFSRIDPETGNILSIIFGDEEEYANDIARPPQV